eukprot:gene5473-8334_t
MSPEHAVATDNDEAPRGAKDAGKENGKARQQQPPPELLVCYLCGRQFGTKSLAVHAGQCHSKKLYEWTNCDKNYRGSLPVDPVEAGVLVVEGGKHALSHRVPAHASAAADRAAWNAKQQKKFENSHPTCRTCNRKFRPEVLASHAAKCKAKPRPVDTEEAEDAYSTSGESSAGTPPAVYRSTDSGVLHPIVAGASHNAIRKMTLCSGSARACPRCNAVEHRSDVLFCGDCGFALRKPEAAPPPPPPPLPALCPHCNFPAKFDANFCKICGLPVYPPPEAPPPPPPPPPLDRACCPSCAAPLPTNGSARFCGECGQPLVAQAAHRKSLHSRGGQSAPPTSPPPGDGRGNRRGGAGEEARGASATSAAPAEAAPDDKKHANGKTTAETGSQGKRPSREREAKRAEGDSRGGISQGDSLCRFSFTRAGSGVADDMVEFDTDSENSFERTLAQFGTLCNGNEKAADWQPHSAHRAAFPSYLPQDAVPLPMLSPTTAPTRTPTSSTDSQRSVASSSRSSSAGGAGRRTFSDEFPPNPSKIYPQSSSSAKNRHRPKPAEQSPTAGQKESTAAPWFVQSCGGAPPGDTAGDGQWGAGQPETASAPEQQAAERESDSEEDEEDEEKSQFGDTDGGQQSWLAVGPGAVGDPPHMDDAPRVDRLEVEIHDSCTAELKEADKVPESGPFCDEGHGWGSRVQDDDDVERDNHGTTQGRKESAAWSEETSVVSEEVAVWSEAMKGSRGSVCMSVGDAAGAAARSVQEDVLEHSGHSGRLVAQSAGESVAGQGEARPRKKSPAVTVDTQKANEIDELLLGIAREDVDPPEPEHLPPSSWPPMEPVPPDMQRTCASSKDGDAPGTKTQVLQPRAESPSTGQQAADCEDRVAGAGVSGLSCSPRRSFPDKLMLSVSVAELFASLGGSHQQPAVAAAEVDGGEAPASPDGAGKWAVTSPRGSPSLRQLAQQPALPTMAEQREQHHLEEQLQQQPQRSRKPQKQHQDQPQQQQQQQPSQQQQRQHELLSGVEQANEEPEKFGRSTEVSVERSTTGECHEHTADINAKMTPSIPLTSATPPALCSSEREASDPPSRVSPRRKRSAPDRTDSFELMNAGAFLPAAPASEQNARDPRRCSQHPDSTACNDYGNDAIHDFLKDVAGGATDRTADRLKSRGAREKPDDQATSRDHQTAPLDADSGQECATLPNPREDAAPAEHQIAQPVASSQVQAAAPRPDECQSSDADGNHRRTSGASRLQDQGQGSEEHSAGVSTAPKAGNVLKADGCEDVAIGPGKDAELPARVSEAGLEEQEHRAENEEREACGECGRLFAVDRVAKHEEICKKSAAKSRQRAAVLQAKRGSRPAEQPKAGGGDADGGAGEPKRTPRKNATSWRHQTSALREGLRNGRKPAATPPNPANDGNANNKAGVAVKKVDDRVPCPYCGRRFAERSAQRHIPVCAGVDARPRNVNAGDPALGPKRPTDKERPAPSPAGDAKKGADPALGVEDQQFQDHQQVRRRLMREVLQQANEKVRNIRKSREAPESGPSRANAAKGHQSTPAERGGTIRSDAPWAPRGAKPPPKAGHFVDRWRQQVEERRTRAPPDDVRCSACGYAAINAQSLEAHARSCVAGRQKDSLTGLAGRVRALEAKLSQQQAIPEPSPETLATTTDIKSALEQAKARVALLETKLQAKTAQQDTAAPPASA